MAYDPNDPADKAIVDGLINDALETLRDEHTAEVDRLKNKNTELLAKLTKARKDSGGDTTEEVTRLERELEESQTNLRTTQSELREVNRKLKAAETDRDTARATAENESTFSRSMLIENGLTTALNEAKVAPQFFEATKALLGKGAVVKEVDGQRQVFVNDKAIGEFVKEWATGDAGKPFILANANGGGGANGGTANGGVTGGKKLADMTESERLDMARTNPIAWQQLLSENVSTAAA